MTSQYHSLYINEKQNDQIVNEYNIRDVEGNTCFQFQGTI